ncbi:MAG: Alcohol dehydrogenase zinc-binding domain protein, partial [Frankiales bacterium]|nr:Alcohol dehydrogenase zinc-binding domain protein [Frankiales bacterium]
MKAWQVAELGEPQDVLRWVDVDEPEAGPGLLTLRVDAVALNFPDVLLCRGMYQEKPPLPFTPGLEVCGTVLDGPRAGERVLAAPGLPRGGL